MLLDIHLPGCEGQIICQAIRESDDLQVTKVIATSGKVTDGQAAQLLHQGFDSALRKPFSVRQVIEAIESASAIVY